LTRTSKNPWLHRYAVFTAMATLALLGVGGVVTSKGVGMAVPDWPTSYGYNMFALPFKYWTGGALHEHSHRLVASGVGFLTTLLAVWLWLKESRTWMRWLGIIAFVAVVVQGVLGGLRVVLISDALGVFHATLAQVFFTLVCAIALFTSQWWNALPSPLTPLPSDGREQQQSNALKKLGQLFLLATVLIFLQLILGSTMRHQHAGLAISDFPLAYGRLWPAMDADSIALYNSQRIEVSALNPITAFQIVLQMAHRLMALAILVCVGWLAWRVREISTNPPLTPPRRGTGKRTVTGDALQGGAGGGSVDDLCHEAEPRCLGFLRRLARFWLGLILVQAGLGAWTIWSNKAADVATAHVMVGALSLVTGLIGCIICLRRSVPVGTTSAAVTIESTRGSEYRVNPAQS
jgi:heme a synthase